MYPAKKKDTFFEASCCVIVGLILINLLKWMDRYWFNNYLYSDVSTLPGIRFSIAIILIGILGGVLAIGIVEFGNWLSKLSRRLNFLSKNNNSIWEYLNNKSQKDWVVIFLDDQSIYSGWIRRYNYDPETENQEFLLSHAARVDENLKTLYEIDGIGVYLNTKYVKRIEYIKGKEI